MVELDCETDFVAKSADFQALADQILQVALDQKPADLEALRAAKLGDGTVEDAVQRAVGPHRREARAQALHHDRRPGGALPAPPLDGPAAGHRRAGRVRRAAGNDSAAEAARGVAMHVAAARPRYTTRDQVPADVLDNERRIAEATAREEGKPEQVLPRIVEGRVNGYYKDVVLLEQASVQDPKKTVKALLDEAGVTVKEFARFEVGQA